jgi:hypothetical protein
MPNLINNNIDTAKTTIANYTNNVIIIGNGTKVVNQYPVNSTDISNQEKVYIITNDNNIINLILLIGLVETF